MSRFRQESVDGLHDRASAQQTSPSHHPAEPSSACAGSAAELGVKHLFTKPFTKSAHARFVLDALEKAIHDCRQVAGGGLLNRSDRGVPYASINYTERLAEAGLVPSDGSVGEFYDNTIAETTNGLYKTEVIPPLRSLEAVECATIEWVDWFNAFHSHFCHVHRPRPRPLIVRARRSPPRSLPDSNQTASEKVGTVH